MLYSPQPASEAVLFQDAEVTVTTTRFQVGATMYPIRGITSVSAAYWSQPGSKAIAWLLVILALFALASSDGRPGSMIVAALFVAGAAVAYVRARPTLWHTVVVHTGGLQQTAVTTKDQARRDAIVTALYRATAGG